MKPHRLLNDFIRLKKIGLSASEIGSELGVSRNTVLGAIFRANRPDHVKEYSQRSYNSKNPNASKDRETRRIRNARIIEARLSGRPIKSVAHEFGCHQSYVSHLTLKSLFCEAGR
jgi:hypothetical protein